MISSFSARLHRTISDKQSRVCLGIDPRPHAANLTATGEVSLVEYFSAIIEQSAPYIAAVKPQIAFFEALGESGLTALDHILRTTRQANLAVVMDAKRGDIDSTAEAYADTFLSPNARFASDAVTVNAYLGVDTIEPFVTASEKHNRGTFVLVRTSNPGSATLQDLRLENGRTVAEELATQLTARAAQLPYDEHGYSSIGAVIGATHPQLISTFRELLPHSIFLIPGVGAQGGSASALAPAFDSNGFGAIVNASRSLTYNADQAAASSLSDVGRFAADAALQLRDEINAVIS